MMIAAIKKPLRRLVVLGRSYCERSKRGVRPTGPTGPRGVDPTPTPWVRDARGNGFTMGDEPVTCSGEGALKPIEFLGESGSNCDSKGISSEPGRTTSGLASPTTAPRRDENCSALRRRRGSGTAAWASTMSSVPSSSRTGSGVSRRARKMASGVVPSYAAEPVTASKRMSASA